jgi:hypothetical protein
LIKNHQKKRCNPQSISTHYSNKKITTKYKKKHRKIKKKNQGREPIQQPILPHIKISIKKHKTTNKTNESIKQKRDSIKQKNQPYIKSSNTTKNKIK